jgi:nucleotide-binding universal stress UspA family protein
VFNRILVPLDGSNLAEMVLPYARDLARMLHATLILFHVVEKDAPNEVHGQHHLQDVAEAKEYLNQVAIRLASTEVSIQEDVHEWQEAGVAKMIRDHAAELQADLVVLCAHGNGGLRDMFFGSIAQQVIRQGTVPVLFIRPDTAKETGMNPIRQILLPLDGSKAHEVAIPFAVFLAAKFQAKILVLTVVPTTETLPVKEAITGRVSPRLTSVSLDISVQQAKEYLKKISQDISGQGVPVSGNILRGDVPSKLIEAITVEAIDMAIIATHGHSAIDAHWKGSLAPRFLPKTPVPVILVRGRDDLTE